mmetsp:Transcript_3264/g.12523  ORF Transcript_3264/g.12523 Transcript_3264/m.12523 type:complete len:357 (+) Transcript_3264:60-1130(+)
MMFPGLGRRLGSAPDVTANDPERATPQTSKRKSKRKRQPEVIDLTTPEPPKVTRAVLAGLRAAREAREGRVVHRPSRAEEEEEEDLGVTTHTAGGGAGWLSLSWGPAHKHTFGPERDVRYFDVREAEATSGDTWFWSIVGVVKLGADGTLEAFGSKTQLACRVLMWGSGSMAGAASVRERRVEHAAAFAAGRDVAARFNPTGSKKKNGQNNGVPEGFEHDWLYANDPSGTPPAMRLAGDASARSEIRLFEFRWRERKEEFKWTWTWTARWTSERVPPGAYAILADQRAKKLRGGKLHVAYDTRMVARLVPIGKTADDATLLRRARPVVGDLLARFGDAHLAGGRDDLEGFGTPARS